MLLVSTAFIIIGCSPTRTEICGKYRADYPAAKEQLVLRSDGTFYQEITLKKNGEKTKSEGTWSYGSDDDVVTFNEHFIVVTDAYGDVSSDFPEPAKGLVGLPAESTLGTVYLGVSKGILYTKIGP